MDWSVYGNLRPPRRWMKTEYGESWEGRKLIYAAIGSRPIFAGWPRSSAIQRIADPRKTPRQRRTS